jgi:hypothetical protein
MLYVKSYLDHQCAQQYLTLIQSTSYLHNARESHARTQPAKQRPLEFSSSKHIPNVNIHRALQPVASSATRKLGPQDTLLRNGSFVVMPVFTPNGRQARPPGPHCLCGYPSVVPVASNVQTTVVFLKQTVLYVTLA